MVVKPFTINIKHVEIRWVLFKLIFFLSETEPKWIVDNKEIKNSPITRKRYLPDTDDHRFISSSELDIKVK